MTIKLPKEVLGKLPAPDSQGLVRVRASLRIGQDGSATIEEINDTPVPSGPDDDGDATDDKQPMPESDLPNLDSATDDIMKAPGGAY